MDEAEKAKRISELTEEERRVTQDGGTEAPFSGKYWDTNKKGEYVCKICGSTLFNSDAKFITTIPGLSGWPSFEHALPDAVEYRQDTSMGMQRTEIVCKKCGAHLGHVFDENQESQSGKHFCVNSCSIDFKER